MTLEQDLEGIEDRLRDETVVWLTTVTQEGQPQSVPVWFLWHDGAFLTYSQRDKPKLRNLEASPRVSLHFRGTPEGSDVVTIEAEARRVGDHPPADQVAPYLEKYAEHIEGLGMTPESFADEYSVPIRAVPHRVRTW